MNKRKYDYLWVIQGHYGMGWEDVSFEDNEKDARRCLNDYDSNEPYPHRKIQRRELRAAAQ